MRRNTIASIVALSSVLALIGCKDTTASGPASIGSESSFTPSSPVFAKLPPGCRHVRGDAETTLVPSPNDPFGRTAGPAKGGLKGASTSLITSLSPGAGGVLNVTTLDVWVGGPTDIIVANGVATWTPVPGAPVGEYSVAGTETITSGTGKYDGATGTIELTGPGHSLIGPGSGPGKSWFDLTYDGSVCT